MARVKLPDLIEVVISPAELETIRTGLRHTITYGTTPEEDRARDLLADLSESA